MPLRYEGHTCSPFGTEKNSSLSAIISISGQKQKALVAFLRTHLAGSKTMAYRPWGRQRFIQDSSACLPWNARMD